MQFWSIFKIIMDFSAKFIVEMFLDDSVSTINRLIVATANAATENLENLNNINDALFREHNHIPHLTRKKDKSIENQIKDKGDYYEHIVKNFTDYDYLNIFKINIFTVQALINYLKDFVQADTSIVPFDKKVHIFLYLLTSDLSFNEVGEKFGLHKSSVSYIFHEIASLISEQRYNFINWPNSAEQQVTRMKVNSRFSFPNCVGFIDACRLKVGSKRKHNQKPDVILLQAVCNEALMFIDVHVGNVGTTKKSKVYKESPLAKDIKKLIDLENHVLGDSEYRLKNNLITPYATDEIQTNDEIKFNKIHWNACGYIGHAFQMLKNRFKKINHIDICRHDAVKTLIYAACVLHNFILLHEGNSHLKEENNLNGDSITIDTSIVTTAAEKRQFLCNYINFIDET